MTEISIRMIPKGGSRKLVAFQAKAKGQIKKGLRKAGAILVKDWARKISGDGFTRNPARASNYPGVGHTGQYLRTLTMQMSPDGMAVRIGPDVDYAIYHETGTKNMPARPVIPDTWRDSGTEAIDAFQRAIAEPLDT